MSIKSRFVNLEQKAESGTKSLFSRGGLKGLFNKISAFEQKHHIPVAPSVQSWNQTTVAALNKQKPTFSNVPSPV
jgi:hypothetical protein